MRKYGFGADIGGTTIKMGFFETEGTLLDKWEIPTNKADGGKSILPDVADSIKEMLAGRKISVDQVQGIGIGVPGPVNGSGVVNGCVNLGWGRVDVVREMRRHTGLDVRAANDANVAALGEMWQGAAKGSRDLIMVTLGTGVGGGIILNGRILPGVHGAGGEIGHITVREEETETCNCGRCGCLEQYVSATGIVRMARRRLEQYDGATVLQETDELSAKEIFDAAKAGDTLAVKLLEELGQILGTALSNMACVVDPEVIVIGGGVSKAGAILTDTIGKYFKKLCFHACAQTRLVLAGLGNDAGIYGCMRMLLDE